MITDHFIGQEMEAQNDEVTNMLLPAEVGHVSLSLCSTVEHSALDYLYLLQAAFRPGAVHATSNIWMA